MIDSADLQILNLLPQVYQIMVTIHDSISRFISQDWQMKKGEPISGTEPIVEIETYARPPLAISPSGYSPILEACRSRPSHWPNHAATQWDSSPELA